MACIGCDGFSNDHMQGAFSLFRLIREKVFHSLSPERLKSCFGSERTTPQLLFFPFFSPFLQSTRANTN